MARAAFERRNGGNHPVEIRDVFFITPLRVPDGETTEVYTILEKEGSGFRFEMKSRDGAYGWQQHAIGTIGYAQAGEARQLPIPEIIDRCRRRELEPEGGRLAEDDGPRWQSLNHIYVGEDEMIAALELKQAFATDFEFMKLHPSLLDVATSSPKQFVAARGGSYLPFSYKRLVMKGSLQPRMYSYGKLSPNTGTDDETLTFDVIITDENGLELIEVQGFVSKRVNDAALRLQAWDGNASEAMTDVATDPLRDAMLTTKAVDAFARILDQPIGSRIIVATKDINEIIGEVNGFSGSGALKRRGAAGSHPRPVPVTKDGILPFTNYVIRKKGVVDVGNLACAQCHTRVMPDGTALRGGQSSYPFDRADTSAIRRQHAAALKKSRGDYYIGRVRAFARALWSAPWVKPNPSDITDALPLEEYCLTRESVPAGVMSRQGTSVDLPVKMPALIGVKDVRYLDATGLVQHRSIGDLMRYAAFNQGGDDLTRFGDFQPWNMIGEKIRLRRSRNGTVTRSSMPSRYMYLLAETSAQSEQIRRTGGARPESV